MRRAYSFLVTLGTILSIGGLGAGAGACTDRSDVGAFTGNGPAGEGGAGSDGGAGDAEAGPSVTNLAPATTLLAAGGLSNCALTVTGGVVCWGDNQHGTLGIGNVSPDASATPLPAKTLSSGVRAVAGGPFAQCAILNDGTARCWGESLFGFIGANIEAAQEPAPMDMTGLSNDVARIGFGAEFACALTTRGRAKCWGLGGAGQLGTGSTNDEYAAKDVDTNEAFLEISPSMGGQFVCAVTSQGRVMCWGQNDAGQLGANGTTNQVRPTAPVVLDALASNVASGRAHACAVLADGGVACWGSNAHGELGQGKLGTAGPNPPVRVPGVAGATALSAGGSHTCAIAAGRPVCWGANDSKQITSGPSVAVGATVLAAPAVAIAVAAGFSHTCVMAAPRAITCLGDASRMQTGAGTFSL